MREHPPTASVHALGNEAAFHTTPKPMVKRLRQATNEYAPPTPLGMARALGCAHLMAETEATPTVPTLSREDNVRAPCN